MSSNSTAPVPPTSSPSIQTSYKTNSRSGSRQPSANGRPHISRVQTSFLPPSFSVSAASVSASTITSTSSLQASPIMSPENSFPTTNSSVQASPEGPRGRAIDCPPPPFDLPESITPAISRKSSLNAMGEAMAVSKSQGLIRRLSNKASKFTTRRRRSSTAISREHSTGPVTMRRRSDSTNTAPEGGRAAMFSDSDEDANEDFRDDRSMAIAENEEYDYPSPSSSIAPTPPVVGPPSGLGAAPVIPSILLQGTMMVKVTKKKKKNLTFVLEMKAAKVTWDKNRPSKFFYIDDIKDIRIGSDARNYRQEFGVAEADEPRFFSIIYSVPDKAKGRSQKVMHLIAADDQTFDLWTTTLDALSKYRQEYMTFLSAFHERAIRIYWRSERSARNDEKDIIDRNGVERLIRSLHIHPSSDYLKTKFDQADSKKTGELNFADFQEFVRLMKKREDIAAIYRTLRRNDMGKGLTLEDFLGFLRDVQCENIVDRRKEWEDAFEKFTRRSTRGQLDGEAARMDEAALTSFLISSCNLSYARQPEKFTLDRPFNEYYISSSHNTYLLGRQVAGQSSVEAYISTLTSGCRCVEVDCWNGADGPVVMHGRTLTTQVSFADVMATIAKYAFSKSHFPLWISLEVHCNPQQQAMMAQIIKDTCGSALVTEPIDGSERLPSPSQLMDRILIKVKKPRLSEETAVERPSARSRGNSLSSPYVRPLQLDNSTISAGLLSPGPNPRATKLIQQSQAKYSGSDGQESSTSDSESITEDVAKAKDSSKQHKTSNIIKVLGELGVYSAGMKFRGFDDPESKTYNHVVSLMERSFSSHSETPETRRAMARHNMRYMMRVYPNGWRVASTNFDPLTYWRRGVQMVALNWQTYDLGMQMNDAMFAAGTDQSGYVLKPRELREIKMLQNVPEEAGEHHVKRERKNVAFSINVISAQQLMRPKALASMRTVDPYVEVEVYLSDDKSKEHKGVIGEGGLDASAKGGFSGLGVPHRRRTPIVPGNGFNPIFDKTGSKFNFALTTKYPDLVFVRWTVRCSLDGTSYSDKGQPLATYTAKLSSLKQGYRTLPLYDSNGDQFLFSTLFCHINIEPITSIYVNAEASGSVGVLKTIGRTVFSRTPMSPRLPSHDHESEK